MTPSGGGRPGMGVKTSCHEGPRPPQPREEWVPKAEERKNSLSGGGRGGAVQEGAEMVRGVSPWGRPRS